MYKEMIKKFKTTALDDINYSSSVEYQSVIKRLESMNDRCVESFEFEDIRTLEDYSILNRLLCSTVKSLLINTTMFIVSKSEVVNDYLIARSLPNNNNTIDEDSYVLIVTKNVDISELLIY